MRNKYLKVVAMLVVLCSVALAVAQTEPPTAPPPPPGPPHGPGMRHHHPGGPGGMMAFMARQLQLTDAQKTQVKTMWQAQKSTVQPLMQQLQAGQKQMMAATAGGAFDQTKVTAIAQQQSQVLAQLIVQKEKFQSQVYNQVLTSEQRVKADQMRQKHAARMEHWGMGEGKGPGHGPHSPSAPPPPPQE